MAAYSSDLCWHGRFTMHDARLVAAHIETMDLGLLSAAYVGIAKLTADVDNLERCELNEILLRILDLMKRQTEMVP